MKMGSRPLELMPVDLSPAGVARSLLWPSEACNICAKGSTCERICAPADSPTRHSFCLLCAAQYTGLARNVQLSWMSLPSAWPDLFQARTDLACPARSPDLNHGSAKSALQPACPGGPFFIW